MRPRFHANCLPVRVFRFFRSLDLHQCSRGNFVIAVRDKLKVSCGAKACLLPPTWQSSHFHQTKKFFKAVDHPYKETIYYSMCNTLLSAMHTLNYVHSARTATSCKAMSALLFISWLAVPAKSPWQHLWMQFPSTSNLSRRRPAMCSSQVCYLCIYLLCIYVLKLWEQCVHQYFAAFPRFTLNSSIWLICEV